MASRARTLVPIEFFLSAEDDDLALLIEVDDHRDLAETTLYHRKEPLVRHWSFLYVPGIPWLLRMGMPIDVLNTAFDFMRGGHYQRRGRMNSWLARITYNKLLSVRRTHIRDKKRGREFAEHHDSVDWLQPEPSLDPESAFLLEERRRISRKMLYLALNSLSDEDRYIVLSHYLDGKQLKEISLELGLSEAAVRQRKRRSLPRLRRLLEAAGCTLPDLLNSS